MEFAQAWLNNPAVQQHLPVFTEQRNAEELDLVAAVRQKLLAAGLHDAVERHFDTDSSIEQAKDIGPAGQRHLLNQYWNFQFLALGASTASVRYYLTDSGKPENWLLVFERFILPAIIDNQLPRALA